MQGWEGQRFTTLVHIDAIDLTVQGIDSLVGASDRQTVRFPSAAVRARVSGRCLNLSLQVAAHGH